MPYTLYCLQCVTLTNKMVLRLWEVILQGGDEDKKWVDKIHIGQISISKWYFRNIFMMKYIMRTEEVGCLLFYSSCHLHICGRNSMFTVLVFCYIEPGWQSSSKKSHIGNVLGRASHVASAMLLSSEPGGQKQPQIIHEQADLAAFHQNFTVCTNPWLSLNFHMSRNNNICFQPFKNIKSFLADLPSAIEDRLPLG